MSVCISKMKKYELTDYLMREIKEEMASTACKEDNIMSSKRKS